MKDVLKFENLSFAYPGGESIFHDISFTISEGDFVLLSGPTGSGKTTLLRHAKGELTPAGKRSGLILRSVSTGYVMQNPENQIVMDTVFEELSFGLENNGLDPAAIRRRVAEISAFFGLEELMDTLTSDLSGGQKQLLSLAAIAAMQPGLLVLDEPTAMLDPVSKQSFWEMLAKLNRELGMAVLVTEHSLDKVLSLCDRALLLKEGTIHIDAPPAEFGEALLKEGLFEMLPEPAKLAVHLGVRSHLPLTVRAARECLADKKIIQADGGVRDLPPLKGEMQLKATEGIGTTMSAASGRRACWRRGKEDTPSIISSRDVWFSYGDERFALSGASFYLKKGEIHALLGGNGSGKSTLLRLFGGLERPLKGKIKIQGKTALLIQDPKAMFWNDELWTDLFSLGEKFGKNKDDVRLMMERFDLIRFERRHPYDLSGGEMQKAALLKLLLTDADILLLDEPTKGVDALQKLQLRKIFNELKDAGKSIILVTHDLSFAASVADRCTLLSRGRTVCTEGSTVFFRGNYFYTTDVNRITHNCVVWEEAAVEEANCENP